MTYRGGLGAGSRGREYRYTHSRFMEEGMATHSSILAWGIPCTEEPGGLMGSQRLGHDGATNNDNIADSCPCTAEINTTL